MITPRVGSAALVLAVIGARITVAQIPPFTRTPGSDTLPKPALALNAQLLHVQHLRYRMSLLSADSTIVVGDRDVDVSRGTYGGAPAWVVVETRTGNVPATDTVYLSEPDFRPLHWTSVLGSARLIAEFTGDSILGATSGAAGRRTIQLPNRGDLLVGAPMTEVALQILPLATGRRDSVTLLLLDLGASRIVQAIIEVDGEEDVATPAGTIHCWVVVLRAGGVAEWMWVRQSNPVVVRTRQELPGRRGVAFEQRLMERP